MSKLMKYYKYLIFIVVLFIPFIYSFFYLKSYWNPYGNLSDLKVAIVNNDSSSDKTLSNEFIKNLKESDSCNFSVVSEEKASDGLIDGNYYAIITLPKNFSDNINNAGEKNRQITTITYTPNQKTNYISSQIISRIVLEAQKGLEENIAKGVVKSLSDSLREVPDNLQKIVDGADQLENGAGDLSYGINEINEGTKNLSQKYEEFNNGVKSLDEGVSNLSNASEEIVNGVSSLSSGASNLNSGIYSYTASAESFANILAYGCQENPTYFNNYLNSVKPGINCSNISYLVQNLVSGGNSLKQGSSHLVTGVNSLKQGTLSFNSGISSLKDGTSNLSNSSNLVKEGIDTLSNGTQTAYDGSIKLKNGINSFKEEINDSKVKVTDETQKLDGLDEYVSSSVKVKEKPVGKVKEYGVAFTPLFISIGLWVGALMCYVVLYYDQDHKFKILDKEQAGIKQNIYYILIAVLFGFITSLILKLLLGFNVTSQVTYYLSNILIAVTFMSIIQFLIRVLSDVGKFSALIILVLQLASSGGTFPVETVNKFFQSFNSILPMTYSIKLIKESVISNSGFVLNNFVILIIYAIIPFVLTCLYDFIRENKNKKGN